MTLLFRITLPTRNEAPARIWKFTVSPTTTTDPSGICSDWPSSTRISSPKAWNNVGVFPRGALGESLRLSETAEKQRTSTGNRSWDWIGISIFYWNFDFLIGNFISIFQLEIYELWLIGNGSILISGEPGNIGNRPILVSGELGWLAPREQAYVLWHTLCTWGSVSALRVCSQT